jgi:hypothetical protein
MPSHRVTLPSHWAETSSLPLLHVPAMLRLLPPHSWAKTETLNTHHRRRSSSPDRPTPTLHCYKKVILTLTILPTSLLHLHFDSFWARAAHHQSSTCRCRSLSPLFHAHRPSVQWHPRWWTSRPSFASWTAYWYVNSRKKIFWNPTASCGVIN